MRAHVHRQGRASGGPGAVGGRTGRRQELVWDDGQIIDLGSLGGRVGRALDINRRGRIVGSSQDADGAEHLVMWTID